jgi:SAM-dependent methyltransferase
MACPAVAESSVLLNLGSGEWAFPGFVNVDKVSAPGITVADLRETWPWNDSSVDFVWASQIIEHLPDKIFTMNELWRVLRPGATAMIFVPTTEGPGAWQDPTHVSFWNRRSFLYYEKGSPYREGLAKSYGIQAQFRTVWEQTYPTTDGPQLAVLLEAIKP